MENEESNFAEAVTEDDAAVTTSGTNAAALIVAGMAIGVAVVVGASKVKTAFITWTAKREAKKLTSPEPTS